MNVLVGCEKSGRVRDAFTSKGHYAVSCDLEPCETPGRHFQMNIREVLKMNLFWDLFIVFPPCTHLAVSGAPSFSKKIADGRQMDAINFFMEMVNAPIERISVENPVGIMSTIYRKPDQIIHPYYFGDPQPKKTCLWLKNLPSLIWHKTDTLFEKQTYIEPEYVEYNSKKTKSGKSKYPKAWSLSPGRERERERSKTFLGIASAMAEQWG